MHVIATDEAGYGPKLGPLVIAATQWRIPASVQSTPAENLAEALAELFAPLRQKRSVGGVKVVVDDSKAIFKPKSAGVGGGDLSSLEMAVLAAYRWIGHTDVNRMVDTFVADDMDSIAATPWLANVASVSTEANESLASSVENLIGDWSSTDLSMTAVKARVITAGAFNRLVDAGMNKSDILSSSTLGVVKDLVSDTPDGDERITVFCDRHGGRRYYAAALQHVFDDGLVRVIAESKTESAYVVPFRDREFTIRFTVKGDRFTPVAFSSMIAKYLRERMMESLNDYFATHHRGDGSLRRTAGYPVDADRFLEEIKETIQRLSIAPQALIRER